MNKIRTFILIFLLSIFIGCKEQPKAKQNIPANYQKEVLLIGTFHYNNPGLDVAKTKSFDILSEKSQLELEQISSKIKDYNPTKIFVEWPHNKQRELDSLYQLFRKDKYFTNDSLSNFYLKNEIFQLDFRVAKKNDLKKVYAIDYLETEFPYEQVMKDIELNNQKKLKEEIEHAISTFTKDFDSLVDSGVSLKELTYFSNAKKLRYMSNNLHNNLCLLAGSIDEFNGVYLTSEWYKRNLYMWSLVQKHTTTSDERIMILAGSSHIAMLELFIKENRDWEIIELVDLFTE